MSGVNLGAVPDDMGTPAVILEVLDDGPLAVSQAHRVLPHAERSFPFLSPRFAQMAIRSAAPHPHPEQNPAGTPASAREKS